MMADHAKREGTSLKKEASLSNNLRNLRKAYGETQMNLAQAISVDSHAISNYECGIRTPDANTLKLIAHHFLISVEDLLNNDFSDMSRAEPNTGMLNHSYAILFPIVSSDKAANDPAFMRGFQAHKDMYECYSGSMADADRGAELMSAAVDHYMQALDGPAEKEAMANLMAIWCMMYCSAIVVPQVAQEERIPAPIDILRKNDAEFDHRLKNYLYEKEDDPGWEKTAEELKQVLGDAELRELRLEILKCLRATEEYRDLADYYLAMEYICGMKQNGRSLETNYQIGFEMMETFAKMGNLYARRAKRFGKELTRG